MEWTNFKLHSPKNGKRILILDNGHVSGPWDSFVQNDDRDVFWAYFVKPKHKVKKTVEAWAVVDTKGKVCVFESTSNDAAYYAKHDDIVVHLTGTYEVEEEYDG